LGGVEDEIDAKYHLCQGDNIGILKGAISEDRRDGRGGMGLSQYDIIQICDGLGCEVARAGVQPAKKGGGRARTRVDAVSGVARGSGSVRALSSAGDKRHGRGAAFDHIQGRWRSHVV
jgi:hypothetical protein